LADRHGYRCTFVTQPTTALLSGRLEHIPYHIKSGATTLTHICSRTFENCIWHANAVYDALKARPDVRPDLIVGHTGLTSTLFLQELYDCPLINYFEYFYYSKNSDIDFRPDFPPEEMDRLRARVRNAIILLDLHYCAAGY